MKGIQQQRQNDLEKQKGESGSPMSYPHKDLGCIKRKVEYRHPGTLGIGWLPISILMRGQDPRKECCVQCLSR